jgi:tripartite-type tricarboxylate transporter receptor subunit TctC
MHSGKKSRRTLLAAAAVLPLSALQGFLAPGAAAQDFPTRPLRMVIPYPPGGGTDVMSRALADQVSTQLGQRIVVENKPGANGSIATKTVVDAPPDGYTMLYAPTTIITANPHLYKLPYDSSQLRAVALGPTTNFVLVAHPSVPFGTLAELIAYAKSNPRQLTFASAGQASHAHLLIEMLKGAAGIEVTHVPYKGGSPALADVLGGQVQLLFDVVGSVLPHIRAGKLKAIAVSRAHRSSMLPAVPSLSETLKGIDSGSSHGVFTQAGTPDALVQRINAEFTKALTSPRVQARIADGGFEARAASLQEFTTFVADEYRLMGELIKRLGIKPE